MHIKRTRTPVMTALLVTFATISMFIISTEASFSQSGQAVTQLTAANQSAISTGGDPNEGSIIPQAKFDLGHELLPGVSGITKQATITNNGNVNLKYQLTTNSLEEAYYKMSGQIHMKLYVNNVLEYSGTFAGATTPFHTLAVGESVSVKVILNWPYSPIDNTFSDRMWDSPANFSDSIRFSAQLENGDKGFFMMGSDIYVSGTAKAWINYMGVDSTQPMTRNSAPISLSCYVYYASTTLQYATSPDFSNAKSITVPYPSQCMFSYTYNLTGLNPNTTYYVRNRGNNPPAPISNLPVDKMWSPTLSLKTLS